MEIEMVDLVQQESNNKTKAAADLIYSRLIISFALVVPIIQDQ